MIEEIKKKINDDNEVLNILPQNNKNNKKKYNAKVTELLREYTSLEKNVYNYITSKNSVLKSKYDTKFDDDLYNITLELKNKLNYFNEYQDAYEILGLDRLFYNLHKYYDNDLNFYNSNISRILDIFEKAGVNLTKDDFYFSESANLYMDVFLNERKNGNLNPNLLKETFDQLFWKSHNMMRFILLNFKHLYFQNEKKFNEYLKNIRKEILNDYGNSYDNLLMKYQETIITRNRNYLNSKGVFYEKFVNKDLSVKDYENEKMENLISSFLESGFNPTDVKDFFMKFYASINEEAFIYENRFILDFVNKLYEDKDSYKNIVAETKKEINSSEKTVLKKWKKKNRKCFFKKADKDGQLNSEIEAILLELDEKYDLLDENRYKEKIGAMINPSIKDYYMLAKSYLFLRLCTKEMEDINHDDIINKIDDNMYSPYNVVIENVNYSNLDDLNLIIFDKYRLLGFNINSDDLLKDNLENLIKTIANIIIYYNLHDLDYNLEEMEFILQSDEIIKKMSNS